MVAEWVCVAALLPVAVPTLFASAMYLLNNDGQAFRHILAQGDFLLATTVLAAGVHYDISDAINAERVKRDDIWFSRLLLGALGLIAIVFYLALRTRAESAQDFEPSIGFKNLGVAFFATTIILSSIVRAKLVAKTESADG